MDAIAAKALMQRYLGGDATPEEILLVEQWYQQLVDSKDWKWAEGEKEQLQAVLESRLLQQINKKDTGPTKIISLKRLAWAAALVIAVTGAWLLYRGNLQQSIAPIAQRYKNDVSPGRNAATLTLAGGQTILLGDSTPQHIGRQGATEITNTNGRLLYETQTGAKNTSEVYSNTLTTQKGNQYHLTLPDGTRVWLNALSSITYPTAFTGNQRKVNITGEAYFEVTKSQQQPFIVQQGDRFVEVLGTSFDINGYGDGDRWFTTLLEGKVKVAKGAVSSLLDPGQQAVIKTGDGSISVDQNPDIEAVMAWKNGTFAFKGADIETILQQAARWYDIEPVYESRPSFHFVADVPRSVPLSQLLKLLEATEQVHFRIEGKKVFVMK